MSTDWSMDLEGPEQPPHSGGAADSVVILLHGLGADGNDLIALAPYLAQAAPGAHFVAPHAPFPCDMAPFGRQWFSLADRDPHRMLAGVRMAEPILNAFIDGQIARFGLPASRVVLAGFSQGTMMALHVAPRRDEPLAGVIGFSGMLVDAEAPPAEVKARPPVLLVHGDADDVVPVQATPAAAATLQEAGLSVETLICAGTPHSIDQQGLERAIRFLGDVLT